MNLLSFTIYMNCIFCIEFHVMPCHLFKCNGYNYKYIVCYITYFVSSAADSKKPNNTYFICSLKFLITIDTSST